MDTRRLVAYASIAVIALILGFALRRLTGKTRARRQARRGRAQRRRAWGAALAEPEEGKVPPLQSGPTSSR